MMGRPEAYSVRHESADLGLMVFSRLDDGSLKAGPYSMDPPICEALLDALTAGIIDGQNPVPFEGKLCAWEQVVG